MRDEQRLTNNNERCHNPYLSIREYKHFAIIVKVLWNLAILGYITSSVMSILFLVYSHAVFGILSIVSMVVAIISTILTARYYRGLKTGKRRHKKRTS